MKNKPKILRLLDSKRTAFDKTSSASGRLTKGLATRVTADYRLGVGKNGANFEAAEILLIKFFELHINFFHL
jgi:hypothetical protein